MAFIELGFARNRQGSQDPVIDEPIAILAALRWLDQKSCFSFSDCLQRDISKHSPRKNGFEAYLAFYIRLVFANGTKLSSIFPLRSDFAKGGDLAWQHDEFDLVTVVATENRDQPRVSVFTPLSGPSSNVAFLAKTGDEVNEWISKNEDGFTFCFPPESFGADILWFIRHKISGKRLLCAAQAKNYQTVDLATLKHGVRSVSPDWFWKSKDQKVWFIPRIVLIILFTFGCSITQRPVLRLCEATRMAQDSHLTPWKPSPTFRLV